MALRRGAVTIVSFDGCNTLGNILQSLDDVRILKMACIKSTLQAIRSLMIPIACILTHQQQQSKRVLGADLLQVILTILL